MKYLVFLACCGLLASPAPAGTNPEKIAKICTQAEERYREIYGHPPAEEPGVAVVMMYKYTFCPVEVTVPVGTTVRWVNIEKRTPHDTWFKAAGQPEGVLLFPAETAEQRFDIPGSFDYLCGPHWQSHDMLGKVHVTP